VDPGREFGELSKKLSVPLSDLVKKPIELPSGALAVLQIGHQGEDGEPIYFDLPQESEGTRRLIRLLLPVFKVLDAGTAMAVDELDASLHTQACELVIALFSSRQTNPKGAQLIATTHDTNLLRSSHLRRDQVWLTEKDSRGATHLYPLTDFRTRKGDNLARGYLQGRYGAIPFSGQPSDILAAL
jgi:AAA15 family ATPase/GTPase